MSSKLSSNQHYDDDHAPQSASKAIIDGYNQTYIIMKSSHHQHHPIISDAKSSSSSYDDDSNEVLFRCGNWCYHGNVQFGHLQLSMKDLPLIIPTLQKQQGQLLYYGVAASLTHDIKFSKPVEFLQRASLFFAGEMQSSSLIDQLHHLSSSYDWIDDESSSYFELMIHHIPSYMMNIDMIASKTYTCGLIIISIYHDHSIYFMIQQGEGDQQLLDVRFPDVSKHGQGIILSTYHHRHDDDDDDDIWSKLSLWHAIHDIISSDDDHHHHIIDHDILPKLKTINISNHEYQQSYIIMKPSSSSSSSSMISSSSSSSSSDDHQISSSSSSSSSSMISSSYRDVMFRFGSWLYAGRVQLIPMISLSDISYLIPALRIQQSKLDFLCDASTLLTSSSYAHILSYINIILPIIYHQLMICDDMMMMLMRRLDGMGVGESVATWLDGDPNNSFFEFKVAPDEEYNRAFAGVDVVVSKSYQASGIITIIIIHDHSIYIMLQDGSRENPLLDSAFPDVSGKGRGYQLACYEQGVPEWKALRKMSIWQTQSSWEKEYHEKASRNAQVKTSSSTHVPAEEASSSATSSSSSSDATVTSSVSLQAESKDAHDDYQKRSPVISSKHSDSDDHHISSSSSSTTRSIAPLSSSSSSRPHHIAKNDTLSKRLDEMRKNLGEEGMQAPWDSKGKPLGKLGDKK